MNKLEYIDRRLHCPAPLYRAMETLAHEHGRSVNKEIVEAVKEYLRTRQIYGDRCPACHRPTATCACVPLGEEQ